MSDFVAQCRREWKRLGVPRPLAEEMASDLASDLDEAAAEGVSAEQLLGNTVSDPRSFAASWAAERGVVRAPGGGGRGRPRALIAFTALAAVVLVVAAVLLATGEPKLSLVQTRTGPSGSSRHVVQAASAAAPVEWILLAVAVAALGFAVWLWSRWGRSRRYAFQ